MRALPRVIVQRLDLPPPTVNICRLRSWVLAAALLPGVPWAADWWQAQPTSMPVRPQRGEQVLQNPPAISWPMHAAARAYEVRLSGTGGERRWTVERNAWLPPARLGGGEHEWSVRALDAARTPLTDWSTPRRFGLDAGAAEFVLPDLDAVWQRSAAAAHPRALPKAAERDRIAAAARGERRADFDALRQRLKPLPGAELMREPEDRIDRSTMDATKIARIGTIRNELFYEMERIQNLGWLWMIDADETWRDEAVRRVMHLAAWDTRGSTGLVQHNQATRTILLTLAIGYDWFHDALSAAQKRRLLDAIRERGDDLYKQLLVSQTLQRNPYDSWASFTLTFLVAAAPLVAGELPQAQAWWREGMALYAATFPPWGGDDGGYANGTAYALWDIPESVIYWDLLRWSTGIDLLAKPALREHEKLLAYFLPPGAPAGQFGDGAEQVTGEWVARYAKSFAARLDTPLMDWYAAQLKGENRQTFRIVSAPSAASASRLPPGTPDHWWLRSVGWVAMHSRLDDPQRSSVYFKSSPFGSLSHAHADQNSFVIHARGRVLAADSGAYDYFASPHYLGWYKQTLAHNAITYDGGRGQQTGANGLGSKAFAGNIDGVDSGPGWVRVRGEAAAAYGGDVTQASRTLVYLRPDVLVVHDVLAAARAKRWEFNLHALAPWVAQGSGWQTGSGETSLCVDVRADAALGFEQSDRLQPPPASGKPAPNSRGVWALKRPAERAEFVSVLRIGCAAAELPGADAGLGELVVRAEGLSVTRGPAGLAVAR